MDRAYVELKIDIDRMAGGKEMLDRFREGKAGGIPWIAILDSEGEVLATADGPGGNIGCPVTVEERAHFASILKSTGEKLSPDELAKIGKSLDVFAEEILAKQKRQPGS